MGINGGARLDVLEAAPSACPGRAISYKPYVIRGLVTRITLSYAAEAVNGGRSEKLRAQTSLFRGVGWGAGGRGRHAAQSWRGAAPVGGGV